MMDLQYAPAVLTDDKIDATRRMLSLINQLATEANVNVFRRFDLMQKFHKVERNSFDRIIDPNDVDRLHQSDWSARRIGYELCEAIAASSANRPTYDFFVSRTSQIQWVRRAPTSRRERPMAPGTPCWCWAASLRPCFERADLISKALPSRSWC